MMEAWHKVGLPDGVFQMIAGGVDTAVAAIESPHVAGVFLTGGRAAGRAIHRQLAGRPGVLLSLELGGNNPIVVTQDATADTVASIVSFSSFISAGQRCTCSRRVIFVEGDSTRSQIGGLDSRSRVALRVGMPGDEPAPHVGPLISAAAAASLNRTYERLLQLGCQPLVPSQVDSHAANLVRPAIVDASEIDEDALDATW